jgi:ABC-type multidrug transport system permease subunit
VKDLIIACCFLEIVATAVISIVLCLAMVWGWRPDAGIVGRIWGTMVVLVFPCILIGTWIWVERVDTK